MRRSVCYALMAGLLFLSLLIWSRADDGAEAARVELLDAAMAAAGAATESVAFHAWAKLPDADISDDGLKQLLTAAMSRLGYGSGQYEVRHARSERHRLVKAEQAGGGRHCVVTVQVLYPAWNKESAAYLMVNAEALTATAEIDRLRGQVAAAAACGGGWPRITTCLVGWLDGKLEKEKWPEALHKAGQVLGAAGGEVVVQPNYAGMTGFSPALPEGVTIGDTRINVDLAIRYSPLDNRTYVVIASPVIAGEY
jgi:hypothetical protein